VSGRARLGHLDEGVDAALDEQVVDLRRLLFAERVRPVGLVIEVKAGTCDSITRQHDVEREAPHAAQVLPGDPRGAEWGRQALGAEAIAHGNGDMIVPAPEETQEMFSRPLKASLVVPALLVRYNAHRSRVESTG